MNALDEMIREYRAIVLQETELKSRKDTLRQRILGELAARNVNFAVSPFGTAVHTIRFKLLPKPDAVLSLLTAQDLFPFANFTSKRVRDILVPRYGREKLIPLFDVDKMSCLLVKAPFGTPAASPL